MSRPAVLVAAFSARQIAESARRAGTDALAVDFFGDLDLQAAARRGEVLRGPYPDSFDGEALLQALDRLAEGFSPEGFVYGAGFEDRPELIGRIGRRWPILGTDAATLRAVKDPRRFAAVCRDAGLLHPAIRFEPPADPAGWLAKKQGGAGGSHVVPASAAKAAPDVYFQRFVAGERVSAAFVAAKGKARILGFSRQWASSGDPAAPFRYGGGAGPLRFPAAVEAAMTRGVEAVVAALPVTGLGSADFIAGEEGVAILEVNPRPGATLDVFETDAAPLFALHRDACRGRLPAAYDAPAAVRAAGLAWTEDARTIPGDFRWPDWTSDRSRPGTHFGAGEPFCTVRAEAPSEREAAALFEARVRTILSLTARAAA